MKATFWGGTKMGIQGMRTVLLALGFAVAGAASAKGSEPPAIPDKPEAKQFKNMPATWRDYLIKARAAERIADPLQRCLAFPDLPGNHWPEGHAAAHCRIHHEHGIPTLADIGAMVDRGDVDGLERAMETLQRRHFSKDDYSEAIHEVFNYRIGDSDEAARVTRKWLESAPDSAYANLAYASYLADAARSARGERYVADTSREALRRMSELATRAIPYFLKALAVNPRLMPAYTGLIGIAMVDSQGDVEARAFAAAEKADPACTELANVHMRSLQPRWGGSYEQMLAYAKALSAHVAQRPQLAVYLAQPFSDRGDMLLKGDMYTTEASDILEIAVNTGTDEGALRSAADLALNITDGKRDPDKALAYLLQETRFRGTNAWGMRNIAWSLVRTEPEWSLKYALASIAADQESALGHYLAGAGYYNARRYEDADREYRIAIEDTEQRQASLREVAEMWMWQGDMQEFEVRKANAAKAKPYIDRLVREYPDDGRGAIMAFWNDVFVNKTVREPAVRSVLGKVDRSDPWQARRAEQLETMLKQIEQSGKQKPR